MTRDQEIDSERLLELRKAGNSGALGQLLERYRSYLELVARLRVGRRLQSKVDVDDILQETSLAAHRQFTQFRGASEREFLAWLREILGGTLSNQVRHYLGTRQRDVRLERPLDEPGDRSSQEIDPNLVAPLTSPSQAAARREQAVLLADALGQLPEDYQEVIILRQLEDLSFPEVALRMERSEDSVKNLWARALARLRRVMEAQR
jgi:RNA polymerase sigma-70 factor (ECF subfamily)